ncbi:haloacid dehalogenase type II [Aliiroseovarius crassostreae]|uniref:haloacid dehalogenase type II n=1 Tax=Aliiroseovarius crassostreae TaxID=154981 RepID=UPI0021AE9B79|nr:haloacid dehalogenase type II [Aliiroseovarius crassostreae]UWQ07655.1 haloacid dehalogenase type II [Aliiroseovarius crassostreae]UWQ10760.1 haloacid dehalogenase type II [Aliiroseovarius crassostreae]
MPQKIKAVIFDAYGTLFDVFSIAKLAEDQFPGKGREMAQIWRDKQIEYTRLRTLSNRHADFRKVTQDALVYTCALLDLDLTTDTRNQLMGQYDRLEAFTENRSVLLELKAEGIPLAILSNGTADMLQRVTQNAGFSDLFNHVLSVESVGRFKTAPETYQLGPDAFDLPAENILFVSSNCWDACGATWFGYQTIWLNRYGLPLEQLDVTPHHTGTSLKDVAQIVANQS